jgi:hypothetical protein
MFFEHRQEDHLYMQLFVVYFSYIYVITLPARVKFEKCVFCCLGYILLSQCTAQKYSKVFSVLDLN